MSHLFVTDHRVNLQVSDDIIGLINEILSFEMSFLTNEENMFT